MTSETVSLTIDIVGALGVIASLIYLARQIRQNTVTAESSMLAQLTDRLQQRMLLVVEQPHVAELISLDWDQTELSETQRRQIMFWIAAVLVDLADIFRQTSLGVVPQDVLDSRVTVIRAGIFRSNIGRDIWVMMSPAYSEDFRRWFEREVIDSDAR